MNATAHRESTDLRTSSPILTTRQVSALTAAPLNSVRNWTKRSNGLVHSIPNRRGWPTIPFIGLVEAEVLTALSGILSPQKAAAVVRTLRESQGPDFVLSTPRLVTDLTSTFLQEGADLTRLRDQQGAFLPVIERDLRSLRLGVDGRVESFVPDRLQIASVDPRFNGGALSVTRNRIPVFAVVGSLRAGESVRSVAEDYSLTADEVERIERDIDWAEEAA